MANGGALNNSYYNRAQPNTAQPNNPAPNMGQNTAQPNNPAPNMGQFRGFDPNFMNAAGGQGAMQQPMPAPTIAGAQAMSAPQGAGVQVGIGNSLGIGAPQRLAPGTSNQGPAQEAARGILDQAVGNAPVDLANDFNGDGRVTSADALARLKADTAAAAASSAGESIDPVPIGFRGSQELRDRFYAQNPNTADRRPSNPTKFNVPGQQQQFEAASSAGQNSNSISPDSPAASPTLDTRMDNFRQDRERAKEREAYTQRLLEESRNYSRSGYNPFRQRLPELPNSLQMAQNSTQEPSVSPVTFPATVPMPVPTQPPQTQIGDPSQQPPQTTPPSSGATNNNAEDFINSQTSPFIPFMPQDDSMTQNPVESTDAAAAQNDQNATGRAPNVFQTAATGINNAISGATKEMGYRPIAVTPGGYNANLAAGQGNDAAQAGSQVFDTSAASQGGPAQNVQVGQIANADLTAYTNPFENEVVQNTLSDLDRARQMQQAQAGAQASAAGAFGGSRQALVEAENNRNFLDQQSRAASNLRQAGFQNAQNLALADIRTNMLNDQFNAGQSMESQIANQNAALQASQQRLSAGNQLGNLSNLGFGMGQTVNQNLAQDGAMKQGINQLLIDAVKNQYAGYTGSPQQSLGLLSQALGVAPVPTTETTSKTPGLFDYLTLGASMY